MRKVFLGLLFAAVTSSAMAEWEIATGHDEAIFYVDKTTIRKSGQIVKMWSLFDFVAIQDDGSGPFLSSKDQSEYDCKEERSRTLYFTNHSGPMGTGKIVLPKAAPHIGDQSHQSL
jgi:hypothetical protein